MNNRYAAAGVERQKRGIAAPGAGAGTGAAIISDRKRILEPGKVAGIAARD